jgi:hypothetical protein
VTASLSVLTSPSDPGTVGTPAAFMVSRAVDLSPIVRMCSERGPMNSIPWSAQISTNVAFSERKPYPGWMASAPREMAAAMMLGIERYDSLDGGAPMQTASSASCTWRQSSSAVE